MLRTFPYLSRLLSKLFYEILPAAVASAIGGILFNHYARAPIAAPVTTIAAPANAELMQIVRDDHAFLVDYLKQTAEARQQADLAAERNAKRLQTAEQAAALAMRQAKATETRAAETWATQARMLAVAPHAVPNVAEKSQKRVAARIPAPSPNRPVAPLPQLGQTASITAPRVVPQVQPATTAEPPAEHHDENAIMAGPHGVTATVQRIPALARSTVEWFSDNTPPRPPASLPERNFVNAAM